MKKIVTPIFLILIATSAGAQLLLPKIYTAKKIITMDAANDIYTDSPAVAVNIFGKIAAVGSVSQLRKTYPLPYTVDNTFINDVIMPGFVEAHTHLQFYGMDATLPYTGYFSRPGVNGTVQKGITTMDSIIIYLKTQFKTTGNGKDTLPLYANGADPIYFGCTRFTSQFLDGVSPTVPIVMQLGSGHIVVCNTAMMKVLQSPVNAAGWNALHIQLLLTPLPANRQES